MKNKNGSRPGTCSLKPRGEAQLPRVFFWFLFLQEKEQQKAPAKRRGLLPVCVVKEREKWEICMITGYDDIVTDN